MNDTSDRIRQLFSRLEAELIILWLSFRETPDERYYNDTLQQLRLALQSLVNLSNYQPADAFQSYLDQPGASLNLEFGPSPATNSAPNDVRDALIQELAITLKHLYAPATLQSPLNSYPTRLNVQEVLYLVRAWNEGHQTSSDRF